ncbi:MAG TPA: PKD domain-containing protein, partial [Planctomycetota bacterium]|nr:PKD domain-containing protein [Planctomycetota bacterium]
VLSRAAERLEDAIELHNRSEEAVAIGGWFLSDSREDEESLRKFRIPEGTLLAPGGHVVFYEYEFNSTPGAGASFDLADYGGEVYLSAADGDGNLTGYIVGADFDAAPSGVSAGRHPTSIGLDFTALSSRTFGRDDPASLDDFRAGAGAPNAPPRIGPVVINEISYHPPEGEAEFLELHNLTGEPIALHEVGSGLGWRLDGLLNLEGTDDFEFPAGAVIPARGYLLVVAADPTSFQSRHGVSDSVPIVGPYGGALDNGGEQLKLLRPDVDLPGGGFVTVDHVRYADGGPWPPAPDGEGPTLERIAAGAHGNDPVNWGASRRSGGTPGAANSVSLPPENLPPIAAFGAEPPSGPAPLAVVFDASESRDPDGAISSHDWNFGDGSSGEGETVVHTFSSPGAYRVTLRVTDGVGAIGLAAVTIVATQPESGGQIPNDANQDGKLDLTDVISVLRHLFQGSLEALPCEGGTLLDSGNLSLLDADASASVNITDAVYTLNYLFLGGPPPVLGTGCVRIAGCPDACAQ